MSADDYDQSDSQPKSFVYNYGNGHAQVYKADDDSLEEAKSKQDELAANKAQSDAIDSAVAIDAANKAAAAKKAF